MHTTQSPLKSESGYYMPDLRKSKLSLLRKTQSNYLTISQPSNLGIPKQLRKIITEIIILSLPKQFIDLNTFLISCPYSRHRKQSKEEKNIFFPFDHHLLFLSTPWLLYLFFIPMSQLYYLYPVSLILIIPLYLLGFWSHVLIWVWFISLIFAISTNIQTYIGYYLLLFSWLKL